MLNYILILSRASGGALDLLHLNPASRTVIPCSSIQPQCTYIASHILICTTPSNCSNGNTATGLSFQLINWNMGTHSPVHTPSSASSPLSTRLSSLQSYYCHHALTTLDASVIQLLHLAKRARGAAALYMFLLCGSTTLGQDPQCFVCGLHLR